MSKITNLLNLLCTCMATVGEWGVKLG